MLFADCFSTSEPSVNQMGKINLFPGINLGMRPANEM